MDGGLRDWVTRKSITISEKKINLRGKPMGRSFREVSEKERCQDGAPVERGGKPAVFPANIGREESVGKESSSGFKRG